MSEPAALPPHAVRRLVVKVGSSLLVASDGEVRAAWLDALMAEVATRSAAGLQTVIVSSGAIALGARTLRLAKGGRASLDDAQAAAAVGQIALAGVWATTARTHGLTAAQILVTLDDLEDRRRYLNVAATLDRLLTLGCVPVINENDSVATAEIRFGDNDRLAARVASAARADALILLSDVDGLYTADPARDPNARKIARVTKIDAAMEAGAGAAGAMGTGGMAAKLAAAKIASGAGVPMWIADGRRDGAIAGAVHGTLFVAAARARGRKPWLAGHSRARGTISVDAGAVAAIAKGASLLAAGVTGVTGRFARGDVVEIADADGRIVARGLSEYDAEDATAIAGKGRLDGPPRAAMVHRDHLVRL